MNGLCIFIVVFSIVSMIAECRPNFGSSYPDLDSVKTEGEAKYNEAVTMIKGKIFVNYTIVSIWIS